MCMAVIFYYDSVVIVFTFYTAAFIVFLNLYPVLYHR